MVTPAEVGSSATCDGQTPPHNEPIYGWKMVEVMIPISLLSRLVDDATEHGFDPAVRGEARRILYSLDAILRLHFAQEEELLTSIALGEAETIERR